MILVGTQPETITIPQAAAADKAADMTLRVPPKPGTYYYFCTVPGHAQGGMWGTLRVR